MHDAARAHQFLHLGLAGRAIERQAGQAAEFASKDPSIAAIASQLAAQHYGLQSVAERIEDDPHNRTRFAAIGDFTPEPCGVDQTSLILSVPDKAGAVVSLIEPLARHGVSMKRFESRPARQGAWEYYFYVDVLGHRSTPSGLALRCNGASSAHPATRIPASPKVARNKGRVTETYR